MADKKDLTAKIEKLRIELSNAKIALHSGESKDTSKLRKIKREIAQHLTELNKLND